MQVVKEDAATAIKHAISANTKILNLHEGEADAGVRFGDGGKVVAVRPNSKASAGGVGGSHVLVKVGSKTVRKTDTAAAITKQVTARPIQLTFKKPKAELTIRNLYLLENGAKILTKAIPADNDYERVAVEKCSLGDDGTKVLAKHALAVPAKCRNLRGLYLCANSIGPAGAKSLASALKHLPELRTLRLDSNAVLCEGAKALFTALPGTKLERIGLMNNQIAESGCNALAKVMARCSALTSVNLQANQITDSACRKIMLALPKSNVDHLELSLNPITERGEKMVQRGRVSQARERKIWKTFETIDTDGSGELNKQEVAAMAAALGAPLVESLGSIHLSTRKLDEAFAQMDPNGDGTVSFAEFHEWYDKYVSDGPGAPAPEPELEPEPEPEPEPKKVAAPGTTADDDTPRDATQMMVSRVWEYRRRATLPPSHYSKDVARKLRAELMEMKLEALTKRAQSLGVAEDRLEAAANAESGGAGSPRDTKGAIVDLIMNRDPFQDNLRGLVALLRDHGQHPRVGCRCLRDDVACSICVKAAAVAEACCWALRLLVTEACASATADDVGIWLRCGALEAMHKTMENHPIAVPPDTPSDSVIQQNGCHAVQLVVEKLGPDAQEYACELGYCEIVVAALNGTKLAIVHERAAAALRALAKDCFVNKYRIGDIGGVEALVHSLKLHSTTPEIVTHTLWSLWHLCRPPENPSTADADATEHDGDLSESEVTMHKQWAASNHRRVVAAKAADAAASAKAKFPWVDSIQAGSDGLLGVIGEVPASASLGRARAVNVAQDHQLALVLGKSLADAGQKGASVLDQPVAMPNPVPAVSAMTVSAELRFADVGEVGCTDSPRRHDASSHLKRTKGWGESPMLLKSALHDEQCIAALAEYDNKRDHQETSEMINAALYCDADIRTSQAKVNQEAGAWLDRFGESGVVSYLDVRNRQRLLAEAKEKLKADFEERKRKILVRYMQRTGVDEDEAEWHDHQVKKIQKATRSRQQRKQTKKSPKKNQKKAKAKPMTKDQKAALKKQKELLKQEREAARAEQVRIAEEEAQEARIRSRNRLRASLAKVVGKSQAQRIKDEMKTNLAQIAQEQNNEALKSLEAKLRDAQEQMTLDLGSSQGFFPFEEPHWTEVCPLAPILPPLQRGDQVKVRVDEAVSGIDRDNDSTLSATGTSIAVEELEEGIVRKEDRYEPGNFFVKIEGVREPIKKERRQLLQRLTRVQYAEAEMKHLKAAALQSLKNQQTAEYQYAMELFSQVMDSLIPELTVNAALDSLTTTSSADGLVVQALEDAEREARDEWMAELKEKELKCQQQRTKLMQRKREQMIHSYICREGWEINEDNRLKAAQNAAAEKMQKMFRAKRSGVPYGLHNGDGTYKRRKKQTAKPKDKRVLKAEAKLAKEMQEAAEAERQAEQEELEAKQAAETYEKEQEEARIAREQAAEEEEQARIAAEASLAAEAAARVAQENAHAELEDVQRAQVALAQAEEALQLANDRGAPSAEVMEMQQQVDAAKAAVDKEQAEYDRAREHADAERKEATESAKVAEKEAAEAAAARLLADKETAEAEEARIVKEREEEQARAAREKATKEAADVEKQKNRLANTNRAVEEERKMQLAQEQAAAKLLEEQAARLREEREKLQADEDTRVKEQQKHQLEREAEQLREREASVDFSIVEESMEEVSPTGEKRQRKSGLCTWLSSCVCGVGSENAVQDLYAPPPSSQVSSKLSFDSDSSDAAPSPATCTPRASPPSPQLPGAVTESLLVGEPESEALREHLQSQA